MDSGAQCSVSLRANRRGDWNNRSLFKDVDGSFYFPGRMSQDHAMKIVWKRGFIRLALVVGILWMFLILTALLFHIWSCQSSITFLSAICNKESKVFMMLDTMGLLPKPQHRCPIPLQDDPDAIVIPKRRISDNIVQHLSYVLEDESVNNDSQSLPLFGGHQSWSQREQSFKLNSTMKVHCGFMHNGGAEMDPVEVEYVKKCRFVVASGIFDGYDTPHQPSNIRYLWRGKHTFAIARHKHHHSIYEEADAIKRRKRYARPLIDLHMKIYRYEGMEPWSPNKRTVSDVPEGAIIIREHTAINNLFSCLWFNEVNLFTPRDQLSFGYVVYRLGSSFNFYMFPNCEYNSLFVLHPHTREHSSVVEWVKSLDEFKGSGSGLKESRGGLGLWTPYTGDLNSVYLPPVARTSKAG
ncbi:PREDICTED: uncharacterized protein LOC104607152 isoform X2 [Nelumbo nucifera]|uniref:Uncharacterized protein LOC104607152 isoform X2 n=1 Tax=Nelumbo nucifera TaxID=4432 RepID=A0A1U8AT41_NELNU|nr:PREDICTED: uncharacterized protein LOC104607152 isoform X2 [Nelumbo nucifera]